MKTLLVTGGCGFIGSNFIRRFLSTHPGWKVINLDKLTYSGNRENTRDLEHSPQYEFVQGDICEEGLAHSLMPRVNGVIHFAAETHVDRSIESPNDFLSTNIFGTWNLLEAARRHRVPRFIQISTDEVYGSIASGSVSEEAPLAPNSPYAASKAASDHMIRSARVTYDYSAIIIRSSNNFGPRQFPEKVIPLFITNLLENKKLPLYGKGVNRREWLFVEDNCAAIELVFDKGKDGEIYNVGCGNEMSNLELARMILKLIGGDEEKIEYVADRPGHDLRYSINTSKIERLGFRPQSNFREALERTVAWYRENQAWWKPLKRDKFTVK